jgi:imidazolonepropionase-like amidohydrolase
MKLYIIYGVIMINYNKKSLIISFTLIVSYTLCCCTSTTLKETTALPNTTTLENIKANPTQNNAHYQNLLALYNASLIDGNNDNIRPNTTVIINESRIIDIIDENGTNIIAKHRFHKNDLNATLIDLSGKFIVPGLFDTHAHVAGVLEKSFNQSSSEEMLRKLLAYGVTTIRNPGGPTEQSVDLKEKASSGKIVGPQVFTAGRLLNSPFVPIPFVEKKVNSIKDLGEEIDNQAKAGVDFVKLYVGLTPDLVEEAINKAHSHGIKVIGHLYLTSWTDAANMGIDFLTHGVPVNPHLLSDSNRETFERNGGGGPFDHFLWLKLVDIDSREIDEMIDALVKNNVYVDPTLSIYEAMIMDNPKDQNVWPKILQLTKKMHDAGVKLTSGTDIPNFGLVAGKSLHRELELLEDSGISASEVIRIATRNGAESLGILNNTGTIEKGKQADMIVLPSSPLEDISNTKNIEMVISNGKIIDRNKALSY